MTCSSFFARRRLWNLNRQIRSGDQWLGHELGRGHGQLSGCFLETVAIPEKNHGKQSGNQKINHIAVGEMGLEGKISLGKQILSRGFCQRALQLYTGESAAIQGIKKASLVVPETEKTLQGINGGLRLVREDFSGKIHDGVIDQCVESTVFPGEIPIENFSGNTDVIAECTDGDILIGPIKHGSEQTLLQFSLAFGGLGGDTLFVHDPYLIAVFYIQYIKNPQKSNVFV